MLTTLLYRDDCNVLNSAVGITWPWLQSQPVLIAEQMFTTASSCDWMRSWSDIFSLSYFSSFRYLCLASIHCPGPSNWLASPVCCHQCPEHPGACCCWRPAVTRPPLITPPSLSHLYHLPALLGEETRQVLFCQPLTTSNLTDCTSPALLTGGCCRLIKNSFFLLSFSSSNDRVNLTFQMNVLCNWNIQVFLSFPHKP